MRSPSTSDAFPDSRNADPRHEHRKPRGHARPRHRQRACCDSRLGRACLRGGAPRGRTSPTSRRALAHDPGYSAAWKAYGRALAEAGRAEEAIEAYRRGIEAAESKGDIQAAKEMRVFRRRLEKAR